MRTCRDRAATSSSFCTTYSATTSCRSCSQRPRSGRAVRQDALSSSPLAPAQQLFSGPRGQRGNGRQLLPAQLRLARRGGGAGSTLSLWRCSSLNAWSSARAPSTCAQPTHVRSHQTRPSPPQRSCAPPSAAGYGPSSLGPRGTPGPPPGPGPGPRLAVQGLQVVRGGGGVGRDNLRHQRPARRSSDLDPAQPRAYRPYCARPLDSHSMLSPPHARHGSARATGRPGPEKPRRGGGVPCRVLPVDLGEEPPQVRLRPRRA